jgi:hypothetical protein
MIAFFEFFRSASSTGRPPWRGNLSDAFASRKSDGEKGLIFVPAAG